MAKIYQTEGGQPGGFPGGQGTQGGQGFTSGGNTNTGPKVD